MRAVTLPALMMLAALSACGGAKDKGPERKTAAGEVLGGSISDAMLPLDTVQSQSPPAAVSAGDDAEDQSSDPAAADADQPASRSSPPASSSAPAAPASASAAPDAAD